MLARIAPLCSLHSLDLNVLSFCSCQQNIGLLMLALYWAQLSYERVVKEALDKAEQEAQK